MQRIVFSLGRETQIHVMVIGFGDYLLVENRSWVGENFVLLDKLRKNALYLSFWVCG